LGISIVTAALHDSWYLAFVPVVYIASITMISRGEVHGGKKTTLYLAGILYLVVIGLISFFAFRKENFLITVVFLIPFAWMIFDPLIKAVREPVGPKIGRAVKAGVIGLIMMNASWAAAFGFLGLALIIILLLPLSLYLSKSFAVT
jgi:4-hydroxybenzoate polyprenyltransferase